MSSTWRSIHDKVKDHVKEGSIGFWNEFKVKVKCREGALIKNVVSIFWKMDRCWKYFQFNDNVGQKREKWKFENWNLEICKILLWNLSIKECRNLKFGKSLK